MPTGRSDEEGEAATTPPVPVAAMTILEVVPTDVGALKEEDAEEEEERIAVEDGTEVEKVEVTDATTSETVMVLVMVWVEVCVVSCAMARRGSKSPVAKLEMRILNEGLRIQLVYIFVK